MAKASGCELVPNHELQSLRFAQSQLIDVEKGSIAGPGGDWGEVNLFNLLPPPSLVARVCGADTDGKIFPDFLASGHQIVHNLKTVLSNDGKTLADFESILDFGCGCARIIRFLGYEGAKTAPLGCDIDPEAIAWCQRHWDILGAEFHVTPYEPPLQFGDDQFDLIYSISIFTHLSEELQFRWLEELQRICRPGGYLILTVQGKNRSYHNVLNDEQRKCIEKQGFYFVEESGYFDSNKTYGFTFPDSFKLTFHTPEYVNERWSDYFDILGVFELAVAFDQDAVLCRVR